MHPVQGQHFYRPRAIGVLLEQGLSTPLRAAAPCPADQTGRRFVQPGRIHQSFSGHEKTSVNILKARIVFAEESASKLNLSPGEEAIHITSLIHHEEKPLV
jgi:hypothetical protein